MDNSKGIQTYASITKKGNVPLYEKTRIIIKNEKDHKVRHVSVIGWITGEESKQAKILSIGSSDLKLGCMLKEYDEQWEIRAEEINRQARRYSNKPRDGLEEKNIVC
ncbi:hypothetical protein AYI70_g1881 [Smittium culicis]|uniref:Uncharacterized protein n=1 Tax=Smittium culicis TaxID=133412 RepID=A0A1R1YAU9_9FUNG|nr:hypothetical protein AYI70_g1881 [Smittium culicis]